MISLTKRQKEVLIFMRRFFVENDQLPPARVICDEFSLKSTNTAIDHLRAIEKKGFIVRNMVGKYKFARLD